MLSLRSLKNSEVLNFKNCSFWKMDAQKVENVVTNYKLLTQEWTKKTPNLEKCGQLLTKLKIALTRVTFLPTLNAVASKKEILLARDILELGAQWSIAARDIPSFERYMAQLKCYYFDYQKDLPASTFKYQLLGLNLLCLLAQNRVAEFHTELELLPPEEIHNNVYIRHPVSMEQYLMEGSYNKVFLSKGNVPAESYNFFIDILLNTVRDEIAACIEKAYEKIQFSEAARLLFFTKPQEMTDYATKRKWIMNKSKLFFFNAEVKHVTDSIPASEYATQAIFYARELEMIV